MYNNFETTKAKLSVDYAEVKSSQILEEFSFSQYYAEFQRILIDCIEDYGESIMSLFGIESLILFLKTIDQISKEKGTQIIEHF